MKYSGIIILLILFCLPKSVHSTDPVQLLNKYFPVNQPSVQAKKYKGISDRHSAFNMYNPVSLFLNGSMYIYQKAISEQISAECEFTPSCSEFSKLLIRKYGLVKGVFLSADRLMRCNGHAGDEYPPSWMDRQTGKLIDQIDIYQWGKHY